MEFDHDQFGIKAVEVIPGGEDVEPHYSIVLRLNNMERVSEEEVQLTRGLPGPDTRHFLLELQESCKRTLKDLAANEQRWLGLLERIRNRSVRRRQEP